MTARCRVPTAAPGADDERPPALLDLDWPDDEGGHGSVFSGLNQELGSASSMLKRAPILNETLQKRQESCRGSRRANGVKVTPVSALQSLDRRRMALHKQTSELGLLTGALKLTTF